MAFQGGLPTTQVIISLRSVRLRESEPQEVRRLPISYILFAGGWKQGPHKGMVSSRPNPEGLWTGSGRDLDPASWGRSLPAGTPQTGSLHSSPRPAKQHSICSEVLGLRPKGRAASRGSFPRSPWKEHNPSLCLEQSGSNPSLAAQTRLMAGAASADSGRC